MEEIEKIEKVIKEIKDKRKLEDIKACYSNLDILSKIEKYLNYLKDSPIKEYKDNRRNNFK